MILVSLAMICLFPKICALYVFQKFSNFVNFQKCGNYWAESKNVCTRKNEGCNLKRRCLA
jgi:hypothetical protein